MKKTTSQNLSKRISQYGALSLAVAGITAANGQIIYHDIDPDFDGSTDYFLNLNPIDGITPGGIADAIDDFRIFNSGTNPSSALIRIEALNGNSIIASSGGIGVYPYAFDNGIVISNSNSKWDNTQFQSLVVYSSCLYGNWCTAIDKYLGLRFNINGNTHYGWAKLDGDAATLSWKIKEFAFNATPNEKIETGQTVLGLDNNQFSTVKIVALNKSIAIYNLPQETNYRVYNIAGQSVLDGHITTNNHVIEANTISKGIYILELKDMDSNAVIRKKVVL